MDPRSWRTLGTTDRRVTALGLGTAPLGGWPQPVSEVDGIATIEAAWQGGLRYFDTAPFYGYGQSEVWLGRVLGEMRREEFTLSTKVGRLLRERQTDEPDLFQGTGTSLRATWNFSYEGVKRSLEESLERLRLDRIDIALIHDPDDHLEAALEGAYAALADLRDQGAIGAVGTGTMTVESVLFLARRAQLDCAMIAGRYTLLEQPALAELLPLAESQRFSIIAAGVYNSGLLVDPKPGATYDYAPAADPLIERASRIQAVCEEYRVPLMAAAIQFPLAHPAVAAVAIGARTADEMRSNIELFQVPIPAELWDELRAHHLLGADVAVPSSR